jgi:hypothetical protein
MNLLEDVDPSEKWRQIKLRIAEEKYNFLCSKCRPVMKNKAGDLETRGNWKTHSGDSFGGTPLLGSLTNFALI